MQTVTLQQQYTGADPESSFASGPSGSVLRHFLLDTVHEIRVFRAPRAATAPFLNAPKRHKGFDMLYSICRFTCDGEPRLADFIGNDEENTVLVFRVVDGEFAELQ